MRDLALLSLSEDGRYLIVRDPASGARFRLRVDERLAHHVTRSTGIKSVPGQLEIPMESSLTPREIQSRIRSGESVEAVALAGGTTVDAILGFATPVIAEREYMVEQARSTTVRRKHVSGTPVQLGALVDEAVLDRGIPLAEAQWDSRKHEDGRWLISVTLPDAVPAVFAFDVKSRYVVSEDAEARSLVGDFAQEDQLDMAIAEAVRGDSAPAAESTPAVDEGEHAPVRSLKEARDRRAHGLFDELELEPETASPAPEPQATPKRRDGRRSVPSWDEIMFGGRRD